MTDISLDLDFVELLSNDLNLHIGCLLYPTDVPASPDGESGLDFVRALGGSERSFIVILGARLDDGMIAGCILTDGPPTGFATWDFWQLLNEVNAGVWRVIEEPSQELSRQIFKWLGVED